MQPLEDLISLKGKTALVTGGAVGIGLGIVKRLHEAGANVAVLDLDYEKARVVCDELHTLRTDSSYAVQADVSNSGQVNRAAEEVWNHFGGIDILVNNAGIFPNQTLSDMDEAAFERVINVNLKGVFLFTKSVSQRMIERAKGGKIINVTSVDALHPSMVGLAHYDASKHGVWGFTKNVALELAPHKIWVNALAPGGIATPGTSAGAGSADPETMKKAIEAFTAMIPMQRFGEPDDIGRAALFLASDLSSYMTGTQVVVDGGRLLA